MPRNLDLLFAAGRPLGPLYAGLMLLRARLYEKGRLRVHKLPRPVICVGNLTLGGTGKTPMVMHVARLCARQGLRPAVISRGYGGRSRAAVNLVSDGSGPLMDAAAAGDEPVLLARKLPGVPILTGAARQRTGGYLCRRNLADIIIMDDGFQHLALARDLNIVLFAADALLGNGRVFPAGPLREPFSALNRADCFVITGVTPANETAVRAFERRLKRHFPTAPVFPAPYVCGTVFNPGDNNRHPAAILCDQPLLAFCGLGRPQGFFDQARRLSADTRTRAFADHHRYRPRDLEILSDEADKENRLLLTTEKDFVKIRDHLPQAPLFVLEADLKPPPAFDAFLRQRLKSISGHTENTSRHP